MKTVITIRFLNLTGILFLSLGFCTNCEFLYLGTFLVMVAETLASSYFLRGILEFRRLDKKYNLDKN